MITTQQLQLLKEGNKNAFEIDKSDGAGNKR